LQGGLLGCAISKIAGPGPAPARKCGFPYSSIGMLTASRGSAAVMRLPGNEMEKMTTAGQFRRLILQMDDGLSANTITGNAAVT
jgi:hypothetical protein